MINKTIKYIIGILIVFLLILAWQFNSIHKKYLQEKADRERLEENVRQLSAQNAQQTILILTQKELTGKYLAQRDSLADVLKIRPKTITRIVEKIIVDIDTTDKPVDVNPVENNLWLVADSDKCWLWEGIALLKNEDLDITRTYFDYHNSVTDIFWSERPKKFLFIRYGKKQFYQKSLPECGKVITREIQIIKK